MALVLTTVLPDFIKISLQENAPNAKPNVLLALNSMTAIHVSKPLSSSS